MSVHITLTDDLVEQLDHMATDRTAFVAEKSTSRRVFEEGGEAAQRLSGSARGGAPVRMNSWIASLDEETARINAVADELNREGNDVLEYQILP